MLSVFGYIAGLLGLVANVPYIIDILRGTTKPHRISWTVFLLVNLINLANQMASGATSSLWLVVGFSMSQCVIVLLSVKRGMGGLAKLDMFCLSMTVVGLALWAYFQDPMVSVVCNIIVSIIAMVPTIIKAYNSPQTETKSTWLLGAIGAFLSALSVGELNMGLLLFPLYSALVQALVYGLLEYRRPVPNRTRHYRQRLRALLRQVS